MPNENSETEPLLDEEDGDKEEEPTHSVDLDVQVPFIFLLTRAMPSQGERGRRGGNQLPWSTLHPWSCRIFHKVRKRNFNLFSPTAQPVLCKAGLLHFSLLATQLYSCHGQGWFQ